MAINISTIRIKAEPEKVWDALTKPELVRKWQYGSKLITDWVVGNKNTFHRNYDRFSNRPVSYSTSSYSHKDNLKVEDFKQNFILVKIFNKNLQ
ncbi:MAG: SRPBCC domain-containing protein [Ignavibacteriaceae bacterium]